MTEEKRAFTRIPFRAKAEMTVDHLSFLSESIYNLSLGGCLFPVEAEFKPGTECRLKILLSGTKGGLFVHVDGEVVRQEPGAVAIKFFQIKTESFYHLQNIVRYNFPNPEKIEREIYGHSGSA